MITIQAAALASAMKAAASVVASGNTIPILSNVHLKASADVLEIATTDLDILYQQRIPLAVGGDLQTTVDARRLAALAGSAEKGAQLSLENKDGRLTVKAGRSRWVLPVLPVDDFPMIARGDHAATLDLPAAEFSAALARCSWSACTEPTRYYMCGIFFHAEASKLRLVATNGHTLVATPLDIDWPEGAPDIVIPNKLVRLLTSLTSEARETVAVGWSDKIISVASGDVTVTGKTVEGTFPEYRRVIPAESKANRIDPVAVAKAIRRVQLVATDKTRSVKWEQRKDALELSVSSTEGGTACEEILAECAEAEPTGYNAQYLLQMIDALGGDTIEIHQENAGSPALFRRLPCDGAVGVVMPMRV